VVVVVVVGVAVVVDIVGGCVVVDWEAFSSASDGPTTPLWVVARRTRTVRNTPSAASVERFISM